MKIVVLCGGLSMEREVSINGASRAANALRERGHEVVLMDLFFGYQGTYTNPEEVFSSTNMDPLHTVGEVVPDLAAIRASRKQDNDSIMGDNVIEICRAADMVYLGLHGEDGENGKLQAAFDIAGVRYTGTGYLGSALAMDKSMSKRLFREAGIATPKAVIFERGQETEPPFGFPCVVKPCSNGSSVGTSVVLTKEAYEAALEFAFEYEDRVLVEDYVKGREFTVSLLGGKALPVIEIIPKSGFYDYKNKYQAGMTEEICPANIDDALREKLQREAEKVFECLCLGVYARADFLMDEKTGEIYCLEANTLPGMTPISLLPQAAKAVGLEFGELCEKIVLLSLEKYQK